MSEPNNEKYKDFEKTVYSFVTDLERYYPNPGCEKFIVMFNSLDLNKVLVRFVRLVGKYEDKLKNKDESLFLELHEPLPYLQLDEVFYHLNSGQKRKVFNYLEYLLVLSKIIVHQQVAIQEKKIEPSTVIKPEETIEETIEEPTEEPIKGPTPLQFNPFVGVGDSSTPYSVDELYSNMDCLQTEEKESSFGIGSLGKLIGTDGMLNMDDLTSQLNNISDKDIDEASEKIQKMMGGESNSTSAKMLGDMLTSIKTELNAEKDNKDKPSNPLMSIAKIAKSVADNMKPKMKKDNINVKDIFNGMVPEGEEGGEGDGEMNPLNMLSKLMNSLPDMEEGIEGGGTGGEGGGGNDVNPLAMLGSLMGGLNGKGGGGGGGGNPMAMIAQMMGSMKQGSANSGGGGNPLAMMAQMMGAIQQGNATLGSGGNRTAQTTMLKNMIKSADQSTADIINGNNSNNKKKKNNKKSK
jgi:hypothetical protein